MPNTAPLIVPAADPLPLSWVPQAATILAAFALSFAMPVGTLLTLALLAATAVAIGVAELRRHGGQDVPTLPHTLED